MRESPYQPGRGAGWIEVIVGSMFSGKTEELIRRLRRAQIAKQRTQVFKPKIDNRYSSTQVTSHSLQKQASIVVSHSKEILEKVSDNTRVVGIDEGQFFDMGLVQVCQKLADRGVRVIVAGLDTDWKGNPFEPMPQLMAVAEMILKSNAICVVCGGLASRTQRLSASTARVEVGASNIYEARCRGCFDPTLSEVLGAAQVSKPKKSRRKAEQEVTG